MNRRRGQLESRLPGFRGYGPEASLETDLLLRGFLASRVGEARDRLAAWLAARKASGKPAGRGEATLRTLAAFHREVGPDGDPPAVGGSLVEEQEERLLDLDLVLLDRVAALEWLVDQLEQTDGSVETAKALARLDEGIAEAEEIFRRRKESFRP